MAKLSKNDILKLAKLAKLELSDDEVEQFQGEISKILQYVSQLQSADVTGLNPSYQVTGLKDVTRDDREMKYEATTEELLLNAPDKEENYLKVKRVLE